jgi:hypothetical protein
MENWLLPVAVIIGALIQAATALRIASRRGADQHQPELKKPCAPRAI